MGTPRSNGMRTRSIYLIIFLVIFVTSRAFAELVPATIVQVIDGDTVIARVGRAKEHVRLIGIDAPESRVNDRALRQADRSHQDVDTILSLGKSAREYLNSRLRVGSEVQFEFDVEKRDHYGRLLAYLFLPDGTMINEDLVTRGYSRMYTVPPNVRYVSKFKRAEKLARDSSRGLWAVTH